MYPEWPTYTRHEVNEVSKVLISGKVNYWTGKLCTKFEKKFANFFSKKYAISVSSGSVALDLAIKVLNLKKKDEVIVSPRSYIASASCVVSQNIKPVFVDIDLNTQNISFEAIKKKVNSKTKAIILVHLAGYPCQMDKIITFCKKKNIKIIEDCSQAHGAKYKSKLVGSFGDISIWSFCNDKIMSTCGEGGIVLTNDQKYHNQMWALKDCGKNIIKLKKNNFLPKFKWVHDTIGSNYRMTEMQAAVGIYQLNNLSKWVKSRNQFSNKIIKKKKKYEYIRTTIIPKNVYHAFYRCYFFVNYKNLNKKFNRSLIINTLRKFNIQCNVGSCPEIYLEKAFTKHHKTHQRLKNAQILGDTSVALFVNHNFSAKQQNKYLLSLDKILKKFR